MTLRRHKYIAQWEKRSRVPGMPESWCTPVAEGSAIDLRPEGASQIATPQGYGLFMYDTPQTIPGSIYLGEDLAAAVPNNIKVGLRSALGMSVRPDGNNLMSVIAHLMTVHTDIAGSILPRSLLAGPDNVVKTHIGNVVVPGAWDACLERLKDDYRAKRAYGIANGTTEYKRLLYQWARKYGVAYQTFIPDDLPDEGEEAPATRRGDDFTEASNTALASHTASGANGGWSWTEIDGSGTFTVLATPDTLELTDDTTTGTSARGADVGGSDHYASCDVTSQGANDTYLSAAARFADAADQCWAYVTYNETDTAWIRKWDAGSATDFDTQSISFASLPTAQKIECGNGGTNNIDGWWDGSKVSSTTDASFASNTKIGTHGWRGSTDPNTEIDNFDADLLFGPDQMMAARMVGSMQPLQIATPVIPY